MSMFLHLRDKVFRVGDQGVLPVPLDPDLLFLAENAKQSNIIQDLYRTQMERNRSRGPFGDAKPFKRSEHPFDPKTGEFVEKGTGATSSAGKSLSDRIDEAADKADFGKASASKAGRSAARPYVPILEWTHNNSTRTTQIRGMAFKTRAEAVKYAEEHIEGMRDDLRDKLGQKGSRALRKQHGLPAELEEEKELSESEPVSAKEATAKAEAREATIPPKVERSGNLTGEPEWKARPDPLNDPDPHHRGVRSGKHKHEEHEAAAERSREKWDAMSPVERKKWFSDHPGVARILARKNRPPYDEPQRLIERANGTFAIQHETEHYGGAQDPTFRYYWETLKQDYATREAAERAFEKRTSVEEVRAEREAREAERQAKWEAGAPEREAYQAKRAAEEAKTQAARTAKLEALPADLKKLHSVIEKLPDRDADFAQNLIDYAVKHGKVTPNQQPWVIKLLERAEKGKDTELEKKVDELRSLAGLALHGRDLEFANSLAQQFTERGSLSEKQTPHVERLLEKARKAGKTGDAFEEAEHPRDPGGKFTSGGETEPSKTKEAVTSGKFVGEKGEGGTKVTKENFYEQSAGGKTVTLYRAGGDTGRRGESTFFSTDPSGAAVYGDPESYKVTIPKNTFNTKREHYQLYKQFLEETDSPGGRGKNGLPFWTVEDDLRKWLKQKGMDPDAIWFDENTGHPSLAVYRQTHDAEFKEDDHPRDDGGKFTSKGKGVHGSMPKPDQSLAPQGLTKQDEENKPTAHTHRWMLEKGFKYDHYDDYSDELFFWHKDGGTIAIKRDTQSDHFDAAWRYKSPIDGLWRAGQGYTELAAQLGTAMRKKKAEYPPALTHADDFFKEHNYVLDSYDPFWDTWTFKGENKDRIAVRGPKTGEEHDTVHWEHRTPYGTYEGEGWAKLEKHLKQHGNIAEGQAHTAVIRHYQQNLVQHGFNLDTEYPTTAIFKNDEGDQIEVFHSETEKENPEEVFSRWQLKPADSIESEWRRGNGVGTLKEVLQVLPEIHQELHEQYEGRKAHWTEIGRDLVKRLGYRPERFEVTDEDHEFTLNGVRQFAAGTHWHNGQIMLHAKRLRHLTERQILGIVAHETMHEKFQTTLEEYREESKEIQNDQRVHQATANRFGGGYVMKPDGTLHEEYQKDYPVYNDMAPFFSGDEGTKLRKTDGVTEYSKAHWKSYETHEEGGSTLELAINETLAEMAYLETTDPAALKKVAKPWRDLYRKMVTLYRERGERTQQKMAHQQERIAWRVKPGETPPQRPHEPLPNQPVFSGEPHPAVTQLAHALHQVLNLGDKAPFKKEDHPQAPAGAPGGHGGEFLPKGEAVGGSTEEPSTQTETKTGSEKKFPQIKEPVTNTPLPKSAKGSDPATISSRVLTTKGATDDEYRRADVTAMREHDGSFDHNTALFDDPEYYPNFKPGELDCPPARGDASDCADRRVGIIMRHMKKNLRFLYDNAPKEVREQGHKWYEGAHDLAAADAKKYGLPLASVAGVYAALSPQTLWDLNVHLAKTVLDVYHTKQDFKWDKKMEDKANTIWSEKNKKLLAGVKDKTLGELTDPVAKAMWIRTYDEAYNTDRSFNALSPDGRVVGTYKNDDGSDYQAGWNSVPPIVHAIMSLESGGDRKIISPAMGERHKVRSFYNNILDPDSDNKDVTIDTHAVGAALLRALGGTTVPVMHSFGKGPSTKAESERLHYRGTVSRGISTQGLYAIYADAYRSLAKELGIKPRVLQSITWEAKRRLFDEHMTAEAKQGVEQAWRDYHNNKKSLDETQKAIMKLAGGFAKGQGEGGDDDASKRPTSEVSKVGGRTGDSRELHRPGVWSEPSRPVDLRGGGHVARGIAVGARRIWESSRLTVLLR